MEESDNIAVNIEGYLLGLDVTEGEDETVYPDLEVTLTSLQGTKF